MADDCVDVLRICCSLIPQVGRHLWQCPNFSVRMRTTTHKRFPEPEVAADGWPQTQPPRQRPSLGRLPGKCISKQFHKFLHTSSYYNGINGVMTAVETYKIFMEPNDPMALENNVSYALGCIGIVLINVDQMVYPH